MSRIYDKNVPQDLIKLGGTSMERKFLDALVKELVEIMGLPEDNSIRNLLKHSLHKFLINDETMRCSRITAEGLIPDPIYPRGLLDEYADYVLDKDKAWKEYKAEYEAKAAEKAEAETKNVPENGEDLFKPDKPECPTPSPDFKPNLSPEELNTIIGYLNWLLVKKGKPLMNYIDNLPPADHETAGADTDTERRKYISCVLGNIAHFMQDMYPPDHKEAIYGTKPPAAGLSILSRLRDVEDELRLFINRLSKKEILQAMDYVSTIKLNLEQRNLGSLNQPESSMKKPKRKYRGK